MGQAEPGLPARGLNINMETNFNLMKNAGIVSIKKELVKQMEVKNLIFQNVEDDGGYSYESLLEGCGKYIKENSDNFERVDEAVEFWIDEKLMKDPGFFW